MTRLLRLQVLLFTAIRVVLNTLHRMVYPFLPVFSRGLGVDFQTVSAVLTARAAVGAFSPFLGAFADQRGRRAGMVLGLGLFIVGAGTAAIWPSFLTFSVALMLVLVGNQVFLPAMQAYLGDQVPYPRRAATLAVTEMSWSLAFIAGVPLMGGLIAWRGWAAPFWAALILGLLAFLGLLRGLPAEDAPQKESTGFRGNLAAVLASPAARAGLVMNLLITAANEIINLVFGDWMAQDFGLQIAALGGVAIGIGLAEFGGEGLVGALTDRLGKPRAISIGLAINSLAAVGLLGQCAGLAGALVSLFLFYLSFEFTLVSSLPLMTEILPAARATLMSINMACLSLGRAGGAWLAPRLYAGGIPLSALGVIGFNLLALLALLRLQREMKAHCVAET